ncbi:MAG: ATP synthase F1 subunit gamma [Patescibacteria group bacterium]|jgi:F-type H+-transporting ATPase subunit gamma
MPAATREIKRRIKSVGNTKKVTKAMELVAASKMRKAQEAAVATRTYALRAWQLMTHLAAVVDEKTHPLLRRPTEKKNTILILITPDKGLTGGLNTNILKETSQAIAERGGRNISVVSIGKKGEQAMRRMGKTIVASYPNLSADPKIADILPIAHAAIQQFAAGEVDEVLVTYANFISVLVQKPMTRQLLPITREGLKEVIEATGKDETFALEDENLPDDLLFEPNPDVVLEAMLMRLTEMQLYDMLLEAVASEHSARMMAMRNATDAAEDLIEALTLAFNKARQAGITQDLAEISASRIALGD